MTFFIALFVLLMQFLWKYVDDLIGRGLEWYIITELLMYAAAGLVPLALPLAILISSIMTFGNMGEHYELVAMKSAGLSLPKIMRPLIVLTILISFTAFYFSNNILPVANLKSGTLLYDITHKKPAIDIKEGVFYNGIDGYTIRIGKKENNGELLKKIMIYDHTNRTGSNKVILAESGSMQITPNNQYMMLNLFDGFSYDEQNAKSTDKNHPLVRSNFKSQVIRMDLTGFNLTRTDEDLFKDHHQMLNISQLQETIDDLKEEKKKKTIDFYDHISENFYRYRPQQAIEDSTKKNSLNSGLDLNNLEIVDSNQKQKALQKDSVQTILANKDTLLLKDTLAVALIPVLLDKYTKKEKIQALETATNLVRSAKAYTESFASDLENRDKYINRHLVEWHRKITLSFACMILFFIGAPLGAIIRKGGLGMPVVISFIFFIIFHVISITGEKFVKEGVMEPHFGMWLASFILLPVGIFLTHKATRDSIIFDMDFYSGFLKIFKKKEAVE
ncbi:MAG: LptF/LptG family permease [Bacteroidota bacterium]|nr:LptF/LptG family permease [Bacteroidota bacterium]